MTRSEVQLTLNTMSQWMIRGEMENLVDMFDMPLPSYVDTLFILHQRRSSVLDILTKYRNAALAEGVVRFRPTILRIEDDSDNRALIVVRWDHETAGGRRHSSSCVRYILREGDIPGQRCIELVEYLETAFSHIFDDGKLVASIA